VRQEGELLEKKKENEASWKSKLAGGKKKKRQGPNCKENAMKRRNDSNLTITREQQPTTIFGRLWEETEC